MVGSAYEEPLLELGFRAGPAQAHADHLSARSLRARAAPGSATRPRRSGRAGAAGSRSPRGRGSWRLQQVVFGARDVRALVDHDPRDAWRDPRPITRVLRRVARGSPPRAAIVADHRRAACAGSGRRRTRGRRRSGCSGRRARRRAPVSRRSSRERGQVRQRGRGRRALRQVRRRRAGARAACPATDSSTRHDVRAQPGQRVRDGLRIARGAEDPVHARRGDGGEEVLEVEPRRPRAGRRAARVRARRAARARTRARRRGPESSTSSSRRIQRWISFSRCFGRSITRGGPCARGCREVAVVAQPLVARERSSPRTSASHASCPGSSSSRSASVADRVDPRHRPAHRGPSRGGRSARAAPAAAARTSLQHAPRCTRRARAAGRAAAGGTRAGPPRRRACSQTRGPSACRARAAIASGSHSPGQERGGEHACGFAAGQRRRRPDGSCRACASLRGTRAGAHAMRCSGTAFSPGNPGDAPPGVRARAGIVAAPNHTSVRRDPQGDDRHDGVRRAARRLSTRRAARARGRPPRSSSCCYTTARAGGSGGGDPRRPCAGKALQRLPRTVVPSSVHRRRASARTGQARVNANSAYARMRDVRHLPGLADRRRHGRASRTCSSPTSGASPATRIDLGNDVLDQRRAASTGQGAPCPKATPSTTRRTRSARCCRGTCRTRSRRRTRASGATAGRERLQAAPCARVDAHGKNLFLRFENGLTIHCHLRMTGKWRVRAGDWRTAA